MCFILTLCVPHSSHECAISAHLQCAEHLEFDTGKLNLEKMRHKIVCGGKITFMRYD